MDATNIERQTHTRCAGSINKCVHKKHPPAFLTTPTYGTRHNLSFYVDKKVNQFEQKALPWSTANIIYRMCVCVCYIFINIYLLYIKKKKHFNYDKVRRMLLNFIEKYLDIPIHTHTVMQSFQLTADLLCFFQTSHEFTLSIAPKLPKQLCNKVFFKLSPKQRSVICPLNHWWVFQYQKPAGVGEGACL